MRFIVLFAALILAAPAQAKEPGKIPALKPGMAYSAARGALIAKGFQPVRSADRRDDRCSAGRQDVCTAYPETVSCDGTGAAACRFIFSRKDGTTLTVVADGSDVGRLKVAVVRRSSGKDAAWQRSGR
ncbi:hypothetical protein [Enterovirga rhinocerotis]|uniref:Uncharacterized protein n=1 Tax=Enterovirga rhinocerotis TaxID=1339210 RepID=A0A4R7BQS3_9HYPH|nr:hypothetical protein [Enterovirga rhinocerotis]TDR87102.1 hypothetical protein EV668_4181 [Enterovirga rhinocerotis]